MEQLVFNWVSWGVASILGGTTFFTTWLYRKQTKRSKNAEAFTSEVSALKATVEILQKQVEWHEERLLAMQAQIVEKDTTISQLYREKAELQKKYAKSKDIIAKAHECTNCQTQRNCPVLTQRKWHDEQYLLETEARNVDSNNKQNDSRPSYG